jgi:outer membrane biosynthesis protein TonB
MSSSTRPLRVVLVWRGEPLEERVFQRPQLITVGPSKHDTFTVPGSKLGDQYPLFVASPDSGSYTLTLADGMSGKLSLGGQAWAVSDFLRTGRGVPSGAYRQQPLATSDWGIVGLDETGDIAFFFQFVSSAVQVGPDRSWLDRFLGQALAFSALVHIALLIVAFVMWEPDDMLDVDPPPSAAIAKILLDKPPEPKEEEKPKQARKVREDDASKRAAQKEGKIGNPDSKTEKTVIPKGPKDQIVAKVTQTGLLGALKATKQSQALKTLLSDTPDATMTTAMAGLKGAQLAIGRGAGGLSTRGEGPGGGGKGGGQILGVGDLATGGGGHGARNTGTGGGHVAKELKVSMTTGTPDAGGGLSKEQVLKVVLSHQAAIQFCYEKELQRFPHLSGKVMLAWKISTDGVVASVKIDNSSLGNASAESCMTRQVKSWTFPKSTAPTDVHFPFFFKGN